MKYETIHEMDCDKLDELNTILQGKKLEDAGEFEVLHTETIKHGIGHYEVDIKVCNGDTPYIDAVLFEDGNEINVLEPSDQMDGDYYFQGNNGDEIFIYIPHIPKEKDSE